MKSYVPTNFENFVSVMATTEQLANTTQKEPVIDLDQDSNMEIAHKIQNQTKRLPISEPANKNKSEILKMYDYCNA